MMNTETREWWIKFYLLFGNNGCEDGWRKLFEYGLITTIGQYPEEVLTHSRMIREGYCEQSEHKFDMIKFTDKFLKEIGENDDIKY